MIYNVVIPRLRVPNIKTKKGYIVSLMYTITEVHHGYINGTVYNVVGLIYESFSNFPYHVEMVTT